MRSLASALALQLDVVQVDLAGAQLGLTVTASEDADVSGERPQAERSC